jgi:TrmH family RNA methyltransferase
MLSKSQISLLRSLQQKKFRKAHGLFIAEGLKAILEFINSGFAIDTIYHTEATAAKLLNLPQKINLQQISDNDLLKISSLTTPQQILAVIHLPQLPILQPALLKQKYSIVLDGLQDPGNLGTIIRTADWFGITHVVCSEDTVDAYSPKVVQATMGSLARVKVYYTNLQQFLTAVNLPVYGAFLDGSNIYTTVFGQEGLIVLGNEGNGIRPLLMPLIEHKITIPAAGGAESLNVGIANAIFCSEVCRKSLK